MSRLEVGQLAVAKFGEDMALLHPFDTPFTDREGPQIITQFPFMQDKTNMATFLAKTVQISLLFSFVCSFFFFFFFFFLFAAICFFFFEQQNIFQMSKMRAEQDAMQLLFIISDGWVLQDPANTTKWIREASANNVSPNKLPREKQRTRERNRAACIPPKIL